MNTQRANPWARGNMNPRANPSVIGNGLDAVHYAGSNVMVLQTPAVSAQGGDAATGEGQQGADGKDGVDGKDGTDGVNGLNGADGAPGMPGEKGDKGDKGDDGFDGADGPAGEAGAAGAQGEKGDKGDKGDQGEPGPKGDTIVKNRLGIYAFGIMESMHATFCGRVRADEELPERFVEACEPGSITRHRSVCGQFDMLMGIQRGLADWCMPEKTEAQYAHAKEIWGALQATGRPRSEVRSGVLMEETFHPGLSEEDNN